MNILNINNLSELAINAGLIKKTVKNSGSILIRGLFDRAQIRNSIPRIYSSLDSSTLLGTTAGTRETVRTNSFKWSVGGFSGAQIGNARFMVIAYNPLSCDDIYNFHEHFKRMISIRDIIRNDNVSTADSNLVDSSFNACRFQIYPLGGGFMLGHKDYIAEEASKLNSTQLLQLLLFVTERGEDFSKGGAFLSRDGVETDIEDHAKSGDIAIYDGSSFHRVKDVDPDSPLNTSKIRGRIVALVTIYK